jgi:hypothetical protein
MELSPLHIRRHNISYTSYLATTICVASSLRASRYITLRYALSRNMFTVLAALTVALFFYNQGLGGVKADGEEQRCHHDNEAAKISARNAVRQVSFVQTQDTLASLSKLDSGILYI